MVRVTIWGSCVSRDTAGYLPSQFGITSYIARQSWLSVGNDASAVTPATAALPSAFQQRMASADIAGHALQHLETVADATDVLLLDLIDERLGVVRFPDGSITTRSVERLQAGQQQIFDAAGEILPLGEEQHLRIWAEVATRIVAELEQLGLASKALVLAPDWALLDERATPTPPCFGVAAVTANQQYEPYYQRLAELGLPLARIHGTLADSKHIWGPAAFHYHEATYRALVAEIHDFCD